MTGSGGYFVHGVQLVNVGGELCEACGERKAVGASISGSLLCVRCAGLHSYFAEELAREKAESAERKATAFRAFHVRTHNRNTKHLPPRFRCGHSTAPANVYTIPGSGWHICRTCQGARKEKRNGARKKAVARA